MSATVFYKTMHNISCFYEKGRLWRNHKRGNNISAASAFLLDNMYHNGRVIFLWNNHKRDNKISAAGALKNKI